MGRIPYFRDYIFLAAAIASLTLITNLSLILFLFIIGLKIDLSFLFSN